MVPGAVLRNTVPVFLYGGGVFRRFVPPKKVVRRVFFVKKIKKVRKYLDVSFFFIIFVVRNEISILLN